MKPKRIEREKRVIARMIGLYCRRKEGNETLCPDCAELLRYACNRLDRCPHGAAKRACRRCPTHCYKPAMRERIRRVMRFAGPRMLVYEPLETIRHWLHR